MTDYKSIPLLREKWTKLNRECLARKKEGRIIPPIELEHWNYLRKILILLQEREETVMDEFDLPNRSCNRLQIPLGKPLDLPPFLYETALELFEALKKDDRLGLSLDLQRELPESVRAEVISAHAARVAKGDQNLLNYFLGKEELDPKGYSSDELDKLGFYKEQFSTFLLMTLRKANGLGYIRSEDGKRTVPCPNGSPQESAKFGHPIEEINYTIMDYIGNGVSLLELKRWIETLQNESLKSKIPFDQFAEIFPSRPFPKGELGSQELLELQKELNDEWKSVKYFLTLKLQEVNASGEVISMTPHDMAAMPKAISGLSATLGCPEELPAPFKIDLKKGNSTMGEMLYRLVERTKDRDPIDYDPEDPMKLLDRATFSSLIDGASLYRRFPPREVAEQFLQKQTHINGVGYYEGATHFVGEERCDLFKKGFYFTKPKARGSDEPLHSNAEALLTVDGMKEIEDLTQNEGRMRLPGQKVRLARSIHNPELKTTEDILVHAARNSGAEDATGLFRSKKQEIHHLVEQKAYKQHLATQDFDESIKRFEKWQDLFIQKPSHNYMESGSFFEANGKCSSYCHPKKILEMEKKRYIELAKNLELDVAELTDLTWSDELLEKMPSLVAATDRNTGLEVQEEVEVEREIETEMEVEVEKQIEQEMHKETCGDTPWYLPWKKKEPKEYNASVWFHSAFDRRILFTQNFLPVERKDHLHKRTPFDRAMSEIRSFHVVEDKSNPQKIEKVIIGDVLDDVYHRPYDYHYSIPPVSVSNCSSSYDLRIRGVVAGPIKDRKSVYDFYSLAYKGRLINGHYYKYEDENWTTKNPAVFVDPTTSEDFYSLAAQVRFINGEYQGNSQEEWTALLIWLRKQNNARSSCRVF